MANGKDEGKQKQKALQLVIDKMEKEYGKGTMKFTDRSLQGKQPLRFMQ